MAEAPKRPAVTAEVYAKYCMSDGVPIRPLPGERVSMTKVAACDYYMEITSS
jgi:hypothetical protein